MDSETRAVNTCVAEVDRRTDIDDSYEVTYYNTQAIVPLVLEAESIVGMKRDSASLQFVVDGNEILEGPYPRPLVASSCGDGPEQTDVEGRFSFTSHTEAEP